jgi:sugar-phosphatase
MNTQAARACLFDMDGTLLDSSRNFDRILGRWAQRNGVDYAKAAAAMHGGRAVDIVRRFAPSCCEPEREAERIEQEELRDLEDVTAIAGAKEFLTKLPKERWTIVTSAMRRVAYARLGAAGLPTPATLVAAEDVSEGKPSPAGYRLAASRLGCEPKECVIFEDAITGIQAATAAGARVIVVAPQHPQTPEPFRLGVHSAICSYDEVDVRATIDGLILRW